jgi:methyltransferase (TIGR00027 family)
MIGSAAAAAISAMPDSHRSIFATALRAFLVARSRYTEDSLQRAVADGIRQYVILGAGLDTFAYRNPYHANGLQVFEVDFPATQAWKQQQLHEVGIDIPDALRFVDIDFATQSLIDRLPQAGFDPAAPAFFSWLGVTMYLPAATVMDTFRSIEALAAPGSSVVFDYSLSSALMPPQAAAVYRSLADHVARVGEPWLSSFEPAVLATSLKQFGFAVREDLGPQQINARYFGDRTDNLRVRGRGRIMHATL